VKDLRSRHVANAAVGRRRVDAAEILQRDRRRNPAARFQERRESSVNLLDDRSRVVIDRTRQKLPDVVDRSAVGEQFQDNRIQATEDADDAAIGAPFDACASVLDNELETRRRDHWAARVQKASGA
jgi:hypothetical protein